jgi:hypothetical protein
MSIRKSVVLAALAVMSVSALAKPNPATTLSPTGVGTADGVLNYCRRVDPGLAAKYALGLKSLPLGHSPDELEDIRETKQYKSTLATINSQLLKISTATGVNACRAYLAGR